MECRENSGCHGSDAILLSHLCDRLEPEVLAPELDGMFAIAIYDSIARTVTLIRDFAGIKPLFYGVSGGTLVFASQFDQLFRHPAFYDSNRICASAVHDFLRLGYMPPPGTLFEGIRQLEPGRLVTFGGDLSSSHTSYGGFSDRAEGSVPETSGEAEEAVRSALRDAAKISLASDVPLGCFLSGGVDSPLVAAFAREHAPDLQGYTVGVSDPEFNEAEIAAGYCERLNIPQTILELDPAAIVGGAEDHFRAFTDPVGDYSSLPTFAITRLARMHVTVMLSGDGGDELFWGYPRFLKFLDARRLLSLPRFVRRSAAFLGRSTGHPLSYGVGAGLSSWVLDTQSHLVQPDLGSLLPGTAPSDSVRDLYCYRGDFSNRELAHWLRYNEFYGHLQRVLAKVDRASMGNSLEVRVPFLCKGVIRAAWSLACRMGEEHREPKLLLKKELRNKLAGGQINRKKMGFSIPIREVLSTCFREEVRELAHHPVFAESMFDRRFLADFVEDYFASRHDQGWGVWILFSLQKWASMHLAPAPTS